MAIILRLNVKAGKRVLRGWDHCWSLMMAHAMNDEAFSITDIDKETNGRRADVRDFVKRLVAGGFLESTGNRHYRVIRKQSMTPSVRRDGTVIEGVGRNQAMWNTMRSPVCRAGFTADDLVNWGSTDDVKIGRETARTYIKRLAEAGYLIALDKGKPGRLATWRLLPHMNTGPRAPKVLRSRMIFDPNKEKVIGEVVAEEEGS